MSKLHRWILRLIARHLQILHQEIFDHYGKENGKIVQKKSFKNEKKSYLSLIWEWCKRKMSARLPVTVSSMQTWLYMHTFVKKSTPGST